MIYLNREQEADFLYQKQDLSRRSGNFRFLFTAPKRSFLLEVKMPTGVYTRTKKYKRIMRLTALKYEFGKWMKGKIPWNKGKKLPQFSGKNNPTWKGGKHINQGYVYILKSNHPFSKKSGYIAEHRLVLENQLGRYLTKIESPHHKNKIRNDNRIKNLMLLKDKATHNKVDHGYKPKKEEVVFDYQMRKGIR